MIQSERVFDANARHSGFWSGTLRMRIPQDKLASNLKVNQLVHFCQNSRKIEYFDRSTTRPSLAKAFLHCCIRKQKGGVIWMAELYEEYQKWCRKQSISPSRFLDFMRMAKGAIETTRCVNAWAALPAWFPLVPASPALEHPP
jgi:hypothetical protein